MTLLTTNLLALTRKQSPTGSDVVHIKDPLTGKDHYALLSDILTGQSYDTWNAGTEYDTGNRVTFGFKLYESLQDANTGHVPSGGVGDVWWKEVSESAKPDKLERTIAKTAHGFAVKNVLTLDGSGDLVKVSDPSANKFIGIVTEVVDANNFKMVQIGYITGLSGLTPGAIHYAQADGTLDTVETDMPVLQAESATAGYTLSSGSGGGGLSMVIADTYADIAALLAAQGDQEEGFWYMVTDASADATVDAGWAIYQYLGTTDGDIDDYLKVAEFESLDVVINDASETVKGIIELDNQTEAEAGGNATSSGSADHTRAMTARGVWWFWEARRLLALFYNWIWGFVDEAGTSHTFALSDAGKSIRCSSSSTVTITIPTNATVAYAVGTRIRIKRVGSGSVIIAPAGGVTIQTEDPTNLTIRKQYGYVDAIKTATDTWELVHTPSSLWEWLKTQTATISAQWIFVGTDNSSATVSVRITSLSGAIIMETYNDQRVVFGGTSSIIKIPSSVTSGNAQLQLNTNQAMAWQIVDFTTGKILMNFRTTTNENRVSTLVRRRLSSLTDGDSPVDEDTFQIIVPATNSDVQYAGSIDLAISEAVTFYARLSVKKGDVEGWQEFSGQIQHTSGGTVQLVGSLISSTIYRTAGTFLFDVEADNTGKRVRFKLTNNTSGALAFKFNAYVRWQTIIEL